MANILDPAALLIQLQALLPTSNKTITSPHKAISALVHTTFSALGLHLVATDDTSPPKSNPNNILPDDWSKEGIVDHTFRYTHEQSSLEFLVKIIKLGQRTQINAVAIQDDKPAAVLDICTNDFTSPSSYPCDIGAPDAPPLFHRIEDFIPQLEKNIMQKLIHGLTKEGYVEESGGKFENAATRADRVPSNPPAEPRPLTAPMRPLRPPRSSNGPFDIGEADLRPISGNPFDPQSHFPPRGDGMFVGPDHPIFAGHGRPQSGNRERGPWGGDGYLPPMGVPHGARFDHITPPGRPPLHRPGPPLHRTGGPDNDEFMPPGVGDMFM